MKRRLLLLAAVMAVAGAVFVAQTSAMATPKLNGTVGPGFTISLTKAGKKVTKLKAGKYTFVVADKSPIHNFVLEQESGGKFEKDITDVSQTGTKTVTITLKKGKWKYYCMPHESAMFGFFTVT